MSARLWRLQVLIAPLVVACGAVACGGEVTNDRSHGGTGGSAGGEGLTGGTGGASVDPGALAFSHIVAGRDRFCGITQTDKRLTCVEGDRVVSDEPGPFRAFDMNEDFAQWAYQCAVKETGELTCSGSSDAVVPSGEFVDVSVGAFNACARRTTGELECWFPESVGGIARVEDAPGRYSVNTWSYCWQSSMLEAGCTGRDGRELLPGDGSGHFLGGLFQSVQAAPEAGCAAILVAIPDQEYEQFGEILNKNNIACFSAAGGRSKIDGTFGAFDVNANEDGCAINAADGAQVDCWGAFEGSVPDEVAGPFDQVSVSTALACVLQDTGSVQCWPPAR